MTQFWTKKDVISSVTSSLKSGLFIFLAQMTLSWALGAIQAGPREAYNHFNQWDSYHYLDILNRGYHLPSGELVAEDVHSNRANVGYFPAYPLMAQFFKTLFGMDSPTALLVVAQLFCWLFWVEFFLILQFWKVPKKSQLRSAWMVAAYPASFFLVMGYSESLFLSSLLALILGTEVWLSRTRGRSFDLFWILAAVGGVLLSGTRLVGIPLMLYPCVRQSIQRTGKKILLQPPGWRTILLSLVSTFGGIAFFAYCQVQLGQWNIYFKLQQLGWGNHPNYLAIFDPRSYTPYFFFEETPVSVCKASNLFIIGLLIMFLRGEWIGKWKEVPQRWAIWFAAGSMFYISLSGKANAHMDSMVRYNQPVFALLALLLALHSSEKWKGLRAFLWFLGMIIQIWMILSFTKGGWVA